MSDIGELLQDHIDAVSSKDAQWGVDDCSPWADEWQAMFTGERVIPEPDWHSWEEAEAKISAAGSLCALWEEALIGELLWETGAPEFGDVGIINTRIAGQVSGIFLDHGRFVWRVRRGVSMLMPREIVKVWTFQK
ncbi:hypothetical protein [Rhizobium sp. LC145]|uniref:DUF6950 family protein n=1 Tax=Rhizobium sp. LC145 TaxID=1120688 RepID=UPI00062A2C86|nr:hypothetical protein [Rhizobium sp. LC145]KKX28222.1 hypothetical protein YH62_19220 [Rhizobium sp. LC145]TKT58360.1 hypothetical protein FDR95_12185 [Rhizobiaceae bacterium LC148]